MKDIKAALRQLWDLAQELWKQRPLLRPHPRLGYGIAGLLVSSILGGMFWFYPQMKPAQEGDAEHFWNIAFRLHTLKNEKTIPQGGEVHWPEDGWFYYEIGHFHGSTLFQVPAKEVDEGFPEQLANLRLIENHPDLASEVCLGLALWSKRPEKEQTPITLLHEIRKAKLDRIKLENPDHYANASNTEGFDSRLRHLRWFWATIAFELAFLPCLVFFVLWPFIRGSGWLGWALHLSPVPLIFRLPSYLGYASYTFTSRGPSGGVLYPWLIVWLPRTDWNQWDRWILEHLPPILETISIPIGQPLVLSGMGSPSPTKLAEVGLGIFWFFWFSVRSKRFTG